MTTNKKDALGFSGKGLSRLYQACLDASLERAIDRFDTASPGGDLRAFTDVGPAPSQHGELHAAARERKLLRTLGANGWSIEIVTEPDGQYHIYVNAKRPEWKGKRFTLTVCSLTGTLSKRGTWLDAGPDEVSAELWPSGEDVSVLLEAEPSGFQVVTDASE
jgi:hypothetical protein